MHEYHLAHFKFLCGDLIVDITNVGTKPVTLLWIRVGAKAALPESVFLPMDGERALPTKLAPDEWVSYRLSGVFQKADVTSDPRILRSIDGEWIDIKHSHAKSPLRVLRKHWELHSDIDSMRSVAC